MPSDNIGNRRNRPIDIRLDSRNRYRFRDNIGGGDANDYFRFRLSNRSRVNVVLRGLRDDANIKLLDRRGRTIGRSTQRGTSTERIRKTLDRGTYYLRVYPRNRRTNTRYVLKTKVRELPETPVIPETPVAPSLQLTSPNAGGSFETGSQQAIHWTDNLDESVRIDLYDGSTFVSAISTSTPSDGYYLWDIPSTLSESTSYRLKISSTTNSSVYDWSDNYFALADPPFLTITSLNSGETLTPGQSYSIGWADNLSDSVNLNLYKSGSWVTSIGTFSPSDWFCDWTVPAWISEGSDYQLHISSATDSSIYDWSDNYFTINAAPVDLTPSYFDVVEEPLTAGDSFTVDYQVNNLQVGSASNFEVGFYLSTDSAISTTDHLLGFQTFSSLAGNSSTGTLSQSLILPDASSSVWPGSGTFYIGMIVDDTGAIAESNESNNTNIGEFVSHDGVNITVAPPDEITLTSPNGGNSLTGGSTYTINWTDNISENVRLELYKSGSWVNTIAASELSDGSYSWTLPTNLVNGSDYKVKISSTTNANLYDWSNSYFTINSAPVDLSADYLNVVQEPLERGDSFTVDYKVRNNQVGATSNVRVGFYLSTNDIISTGDRLLGYANINSVNGNTLTSTLSKTLTLPGTTDAFWTRTGMFYIGMIVDDLATIAETNESNNSNTGLYNSHDDVIITAPVASYITVNHPNGGNALTIGSSYAITWNDNISENVSLALYRGNTLDRTIVSSTASDGSFTWSIPANLPGRSDYRIKVASTTNSQLYDYSNANFAIQPNVATTNWTAQFFNRTSSNYNLNDWTVSGSTFQATPAEVTLNWGSQGSSGNVKARLYKDLINNSPAVGINSNYFAGWVSTRMYLESGKQYRVLTDSDDGTAFYLKSANSTSISYLGADWRDRSTTDPTTIIPFTVSQSGYYDFGLKYFEGIADSVFDVTVEELQSTQIDLVPASLDVIQEPLERGDTFTVDYQVKNQQAGAASNLQVGFYLSSNSTISTGDRFLGYGTINSLAGNTTSPTYTKTLTLPSTTDSFWSGDGTFYIGMIVDYNGAIAESNESNNTNQGEWVSHDGVSISAPRPDLVIQNASAPTSVTTGNSFTISAYTKNIGSNVAWDHFCRYWLSDDTTLDASDRSLGYGAVDTLNAGASEYNALTLTYDATWGTGTKYILFEADTVNHVLESNENNNIAYRTITINAPKPDLVVQTPSAPTSITAGNSVTISAYSKNNGGSSAGSNYLRYWLSDDTILDSSDRSLGYDTVNSLGVGASEYDSLTFTYDASWGTGTKYILFEADGYKNVSESNETNNIAYRTLTVNPPIQNNSFDIKFDYRFDTNGWFTAERKSALEAAASIWENIIQDEFADTPVGTVTPWVTNPQTGVSQSFTTDVLIDDLLIFVGARELGSALGLAGPSGWYTNETRYTGDDFEPWIGSVAFDTTTNWFFASNPLISDVVPYGQSDFVSVAVHEIGHVLGFGASSAFDNLVSLHNGSYYFNGTNAKARNGGYSVPLDSNQSHIKDGYSYGNYGEASMDPIITVGDRKLVTQLDAALLDDIGYTIDYTKTYQNP